MTLRRENLGYSVASPKRHAQSGRRRPRPDGGAHRALGHEQPLPVRHTRRPRPSPAGASGQPGRREVGSDRQRAPRGGHPRSPPCPEVGTRNLVELQEVGSGVPEEQVLSRLNCRRDSLSLHVVRAVRVHDVASPVRSEVHPATPQIRAGQPWRAAGRSRNTVRRENYSGSQPTVATPQGLVCSSAGGLGSAPTQTTAAQLRSLVCLQSLHTPSLVSAQVSARNNPSSTWREHKLPHVLRTDVDTTRPLVRVCAGHGPAAEGRDDRLIHPIAYPYRVRKRAPVRRFRRHQWPFRHVVAGEGFEPSKLSRWIYRPTAASL